MPTELAPKSIRVRRPLRRRAVSFELELPGPLDPGASLQMFRRSGDDLLDRWDGTTFLRTIAIDRHTVAFATTFTASHSQPAVRVTLQDGDYAKVVAGAVRATFVPPPRHFAELRRADPLLARVEARYRGFRPVLQLNLLGALLR